MVGGMDSLLLVPPGPNPCASIERGMDTVPVRMSEFGPEMETGLMCGDSYCCVVMCCMWLDCTWDILTVLVGFVHCNDWMCLVGGNTADTPSARRSHGFLHPVLLLHHV